jgi:hypothetical protein
MGCEFQVYFYVLLQKKCGMDFELGLICMKVLKYDQIGGQSLFYLTVSALWTVSSHCPACFEAILIFFASMNVGCKQF